MSLSLDLQQIFPLTFSLLKKDEGRALQSEFENQWGFEKLHFFPMVIREQQYSNEVTEVADFEYLRYWLQSQDMGSKLLGNHLYLNPSAQVLLLSAGAKALSREPGVYVLWRQDGNIQDRKLTQEEAGLLDRLRDDQVTFRTDLNDEELRTLVRLLAEKIVFENEAHSLSVVRDPSFS